MTDLEAFKSKQLEILHELDRVCGLADIKYFLAYGTCLGAVRHQGFIPWDDDIDVFLPYSEMDKLMANSHLFQDKYFIQCTKTQPNYTNMKYALMDSSTSCFGDEEDNQDINNGIGIDMYVLYPYPDNWFQAHKLILDSYVLRLLYLKQPPKHHGRMAKVFSKVFFALHTGKRADKTIARIENALRNNGGRKYYASFFGDDITFTKCTIFPQKLFSSVKRLKFEDFMAACVNDPEMLCELTFGSTYMEFPPEEDRVPKHSLLFLSVDQPYTDFKGKYYLND